MMARLAIKNKKQINVGAAAKTAINDIESFVIDTYGNATPDVVSVFTPARKIKLSGKLSVLGLAVLMQPGWNLIWRV